MLSEVDIEEEATNGIKRKVNQDLFKFRMGRPAVKDKAGGKASIDLNFLSTCLELQTILAFWSTSSFLGVRVRPISCR